MSPMVLLALLALSDAPDAGPAPELTSPAAAEPANDVHLGVGTQKVVKVSNVKAVAVGAPTVLDVRMIEPGQLLLVGLAKGTSGLIIFKEDGARLEYRIRVMSRDPGSEGECELCRLMKDSPELSFDVVGERTVADGVVGSVEDFDRLRQYPQVVILARLDPRLVRRRLQDVNEAFVREGLKGAQATLQGDTLVIEGAVADELEKQKAELIARGIFEPIARVLRELKEHRDAPVSE